MREESSQKLVHNTNVLSVWFNDPKFRAIFWQLFVILSIILSVYYLANNAIMNLQRQSIATGYGFLSQEAGFQISEAVIPYSPSNTYGRAFIVGLLNTLSVSFTGIILSTILGTIIGIARLSSNILVSRLSLFFVELVRNVPLLLQLLFIYTFLNFSTPFARDAWNFLPGVFLSVKGLMVPVPLADRLHLYILASMLLSIALACAVALWARERQDLTGKIFPTFYVNFSLVVLIPLIVFIALGSPLSVEFPVFKGLNFEGGITLLPEHTALLFGLVIYTSAYIAEIVRSGILAVSHGQTEAASALGLNKGQILRLIVLPQAVRVVIPPMTSQFLNLTKNSTLAVAIGYPDLVFVTNTQMNQTGQAIEGMSIIMGTYLTISLIISFFMNIYNANIALKGR